MSWDTDLQYWSWAVEHTPTAVPRLGPVDAFDAQLLQRLSVADWPVEALAPVSASSGADLPTPPEFGGGDEGEGGPSAALSGEFLVDAGTDDATDDAPAGDALIEHAGDMDAAAASVSGEFMVVRPHAPAPEVSSARRSPSIEVQGPVLAAAGALEISVEPRGRPRTPSVVLEGGTLPVEPAAALEVSLEPAGKPEPAPVDAAPASIVIPALTRTEPGSEAELARGGVAQGWVPSAGHEAVSLATAAPVVRDDDAPVTLEESADAEPEAPDVVEPEAPDAVELETPDEVEPETPDVVDVEAPDAVAVEAPPADAVGEPEVLPATGVAAVDAPADQPVDEPVEAPQPEAVSREAEGLEAEGLAGESTGAPVDPGGTRADAGAVLAAGPSQPTESVEAPSPGGERGFGEVATASSTWIPAPDHAEYEAARARAYAEAYGSTPLEASGLEAGPAPTSDQLESAPSDPLLQSSGVEPARPEARAEEGALGTLEIEAVELDPEELEVEEVEEVEEVVAEQPVAPPAAPPQAADAPVGQPPPPKAPAKSKPRRKPWYEETFGEHYTAIERPKAGKAAEIEVAFMIEVMGLEEGAKVLDVGSGTGHHAFAFAKAGMDVTGVDNSLPILLKASERNESRQAGVTFVHGDMRELPFEEGGFDAVICVGTTLGYFDDEQNRAALEQMSRQVRVGGKMLVHVFNRDNLVGQLPARSWWQGQRCLVLDEAEMHYFTNRLRVHRTIVFEDGRQFEHHISIRAYTVQELGRLMQSVGLRVAEISGHVATPRRFYGSASPDLWLMGEKQS